MLPDLALGNTLLLQLADCTLDLSMCVDNTNHTKKRNGPGMGRFSYCWDSLSSFPFGKSRWLARFSLGNLGIFLWFCVDFSVLDTLLLFTLGAYNRLEIQR